MTQAHAPSVNSTTDINDHYKDLHVIVKQFKIHGTVWQVNRDPGLTFSRILETVLLQFFVVDKSQI